MKKPRRTNIPVSFRKHKPTLLDATRHIAYIFPKFLQDLSETPIISWSLYFSKGITPRLGANTCRLKLGTKRLEPACICPRELATDYSGLLCERYSHAIVACCLHFEIDSSSVLPPIQKSSLNSFSSRLGDLPLANVQSQSLITFVTGLEITFLGTELIRSILSVEPLSSTITLNIPQPAMPFIANSTG